MSLATFPFLWQPPKFFRNPTKNKKTTKKKKLKKNKPKEYPQQPETKTAAKHAMSEVCLLPRPSYYRGRACKAQSQHKHVMKKLFFPKAFAILWPIFPEARAKGFFPKNCCPSHSSLHLPNIHHLHLLCPLHHLHLLHHLLHRLL